MGTLGPTYNASTYPRFCEVGTKTMDELGIILNFKDRVITIDEIDLPMQSIHRLPTSRRKALALHNGLATQKEPASTVEA